MAKDRLIRKKITKTVVEALVVDLETEQSSCIRVLINGRHRFNENKLMKEVQEQLPSEVKVVKISSIEYASETRSMKESYFIANSEKEK